MTAQAEAANSLYAPACSHEIHRAGYPHWQARWAKLDDPCAYSGYYVGGGARSYLPLGRCEHQGTWGWDYVGKHFKPLVRLGWWRPPRKQGGTGSYEPDGPHFLQALHK